MINKRNIFIVGVGRSGTSLLQSMLASHSEFAFLPETIFIRRYLVAFRNKSLNYKALENFISQDTYLDRLQKQLKEKLLSQAEKSLDLKKLYKCFILNFSKDKIFVGDKDPRLIEFMEFIDSLVETAYIVHIIRDPRDIIASKKKADWSKHYSIYRHIFASMVQPRLAQIFSSKVSNYFELRYEDLINNPEKQLRSIMNFLGLDYEDKMLNFSAAAQSLVAQDEMSWKKETLGPLLSDNTGKGQKELSFYEVYLIEKLCQESFKRNSYSLSKSIKLSFWEKCKSLVIIPVLRTLSKLYIIYRIYHNKLLIRTYRSS